MQKCQTLTTFSESPTKSDPMRDSPRKAAKSLSIPLGSLSECKNDLSPGLTKSITLESLVTYLQALVQNIYQIDPLHIKQLIMDFLQAEMSKLRRRLHQRLSLLKYLCESLKYKQFSEIDLQIQKQWKKNILFISINTIWLTKMQNYEFVSSDQFFEQYHKYIEIVANMSHFYFREALSLLKGKKLPVFNYLQQQTAHHIINTSHDWEDLYHIKLIPLLKRQNIKYQLTPNLDFDLSTLTINRKYIQIDNNQKHLPLTVKKIHQFSTEHTIVCKMQRLKQIRQTFLRQIQESRVKLKQQFHYEQYSPLEKDDILGCMIYCIVKGKISLLKESLQALTGLLKADNTLLSRKGVDSFRADLESAIQYLVEQNEVQLITVPQVKLFK